MTLKKEFALKKRTRGNYSPLFRGKCQDVFADIISSLSSYSKSEGRWCAVWFLGTGRLCPSMVLNYSIAFINYSFCWTSQSQSWTTKDTRKEIWNLHSASHTKSLFTKFQEAGWASAGLCPLGSKPKLRTSGSVQVTPPWTAREKTQKVSWCQIQASHVWTFLPWIFCLVWTRSSQTKHTMDRSSVNIWGKGTGFKFEHLAEKRYEKLCKRS